MRISIEKPYVVKPNEPTYHVHAADCRDLKVRGKYRAGESFLLTADTLTQIAETVYPRTSFDWEGDHDPWYEGDFVVFPCAEIER